MEAQTILSNLDNGTITQESAALLLGKHADPFYLAGAYLEAHIQCADWRQKYWDALDESTDRHLPRDTATDLIDHAFLTDHIGPAFARAHLIAVGMNAETAQHHVWTLQAEKTHSAERDKYLENPDLAPRYCTRCGIKTTAETLSNRALCIECNTSAVESNLLALKNKTGIEYETWRTAMLTFAYTLENEEIAERRIEQAVPPDLFCPTCERYVAPENEDCPACGDDLIK